MFFTCSLNYVEVLVENFLHYPDKRKILLVYEIYTGTGNAHVRLSVISDKAFHLYIKQAIRPMKYPPRIVSVLLVLSLAGCAPRVMVEHDASAGFGGYHHYAWVSPPPGPVKDPILDSQILEDRVRQAVAATLTARGYQAVAADAAPDFIVTYHTSSKQQIESSGPSFSFGIVDAFPAGFGSVAVPIGGNVESREQGTLMLDIIDGHSKRLVWRGWTTGWVNQDNYSEKAVTQAVREILARFPPG